MAANGLTLISHHVSFLFSFSNSNLTCLSSMFHPQTSHVFHLLFKPNKASKVMVRQKFGSAAKMKATMVARKRICKQWLFGILVDETSSAMNTSYKTLGSYIYKQIHLPYLNEIQYQCELKNEVLKRNQIDNLRRGLD